MSWQPIRNPDTAALHAAIHASRHRAARRIIDPRDGTAWIWPAEQATHAEGAKRLGVPYSLPPGAGEILFND